MSLVFSIGLAIQRQNRTAAALPPAGPPANTALPVIGGTVQVGQLLTASTGGWTNSPTAYAWQWRRAGVAISGATSASYTVQAADQDLTLTVRVTASNAAGSASATSAATAAVTAASVGTIVIGMMGQSNVQYVLGVDSPFNTLPTEQLPVVTVQNMTYVGDGPTGAGSFATFPVTDANVRTTRNVSAPVANLSIILNHAMPGKQFALVDLAVSGTSRNSLKTEGHSSRTFADFAAMVAKARADVGEISGVLDYWYASDASSLANFGNSWAPFYFGQGFDGSPVTVGTGGLDHILWDITAAGGSVGRGIFARDTTKWMLSQPKDEFDWAQLRAVEAFATDSRTQTFLSDISPAPQLAAWDGGHALSNDPDGAIYTMHNWAPPILKLAGYPISYPEITGIEVDPAGAWADVLISLPNGGTLTTIRALEGRGEPATPLDIYQPVTGFEIARVGDADPETGSGATDRKPFVPLTSTGYAEKYRGTVMVQDAGSGAGPSRVGKVRITPLVPFATGDKISYLQDYRGRGGFSTTQNTIEILNKIWLNYPIETIPALRDTTAMYPFPGVGVMRPDQKLTVDIAPAPENALETPIIQANTTWTSSAILLRETDPFTIPAGGSAMVVVLTMSAVTGGSGLEAFDPPTVGEAGRAAGTGTLLTRHNNGAIDRQGRASATLFSLVGTGTAQTVQLGYASGAPANQRILVLEMPHAALPPVEVQPPYRSTLGTAAANLTISVDSRLNGVLIVSTKTNALEAFSNSRNLTPLFEGPIASAVSGASAGRGMVLWAIPGEAGTYDVTVSWPSSSAIRIQQMIEVQPA